MKVYVLLHICDTPDEYYAQILGVYQSKESAKEAMSNKAAKVRAQYPQDTWNEDYTWSIDDEIHLGFEFEESPYSILSFSWEVIPMEVQ